MTDYNIAQEKLAAIGLPPESLGMASVFAAVESIGFPITLTDPRSPDFLPALIEAGTTTVAFTEVVREVPNIGTFAVVIAAQYAARSYKDDLVSQAKGISFSEWLHKEFEMALAAYMELP